ncbi:MAG: shikimate kinase [Planctomycetia bacterium]|nr:shikimate kinase [Planctomycetia bacterium]
MNCEPGPNLALIGYRATGKTSVARQIVPLLRNHPRLRTHFTPAWIDTDLEIEKRCGRSISQIFLHSGESFFRDRESELLRELCSRRTGVIATGGGAPLRPGNRTLLRRAGTIVWLTASPETIARRIHADPTSADRRPTLEVEKNFPGNPIADTDSERAGIPENEQIEKIRFVLRQREPIYRELADLTFSSESDSPEKLASLILDALDAGIEP